MVLYHDEKEEKDEEKTTEDRILAPGTESVIHALIKGKVIPLEEVPDATFSSGVLGSGFGILPSEGKVYAPFDGVCESVFDTLHAMGLKSNQGIEVLIHVGLETVRLEGKPFKAHVKSGDPIQKGQLLLEFDLAQIQEGAVRS